MKFADTAKNMQAKKMTDKKAQVIGAGLAGCEAAWQLAKRGIHVDLYEMKPSKKTPAHKIDLFSELVCSNSLRSMRIQNAVGLLKEEMRLLDSLIMQAADRSSVPAGGALAVDRIQFSSYITETILKHPNISVHEKEIDFFPDAPCIIASGPLTSDALADAIQKTGLFDYLHFYDAAAPILMKDSLDMDIIFKASRYGRGDDYLNCPLCEEEYNSFVNALTEAETVAVKGFEETSVFEGCMPIESMAKRGRMSLAFGPLKPVGLIDPRSGKMPFAVVQLRQDDAMNTMYNIVGFQTRLTFKEQQRVFAMIPGLKNAQFARYGVMHRNTFINSSQILDANYQMKEKPGIYFAGQMSGVEGYVESASSGLAAGIALARQLNGQDTYFFTKHSAIGALANYVSTPNSHFQPMNITFGLIPPLGEKVRGKQNRYLKIAERALDELKQQIKEMGEGCNE